MNIVCDVIVLTWNQMSIIKEFVNSYLACTQVPSRLIIVDNASQDGTVDYLKTLKSTDLCRIEVVYNEENQGFVGGMNQGIEMSKAPYVILANNDLYFSKGWLAEIINVFDGDQTIGVLNPNSNNLENNVPETYDVVSWGEKILQQYQGQFVEMPCCIGFCMAIKSELIKKVGGLSREFFPIFFEDTDYSRKAMKAGYKIGMAKGSYVYHDEHASFKGMGNKRAKFFNHSREVFFKKWGKIMRVGLIPQSKECIDKEYLTRAVKIARDGHFVTIYTKKSWGVTKQDVFRSLGMLDHTGINFRSYSNIMTLFFLFLVKKKNMHVLCANALALQILSFLRKIVYFKMINADSIIETKWRR